MIAIASLSEGVLDAMVFIAVLESLKTITSRGWSTIWYMYFRAWDMAYTSAEKMLAPSDIDPASSYSSSGM